MVMAGEQHIDAGLFDNIKREFLPAYRLLDLIADFERQHRVMCDEDAEGFFRRSAERIANELDLFRIDASVLERQRPRRVDAEYCRSGQLDIRTERIVDEAPISRQRRE